MNTRYTAEDIIGLRPCYRDSEIKELFDGRESLGVDDIVSLGDNAFPSVNYDNWYWLACELLPVKVLRKWLDVIVSDVIADEALSSDSRAVREWAAKWLDGTAHSASDTWDVIRRAGLVGKIHISWSVIYLTSPSPSREDVRSAAWHATRYLPRDRGVIELVKVIKRQLKKNKGKKHEPAR